MNNNAAIDLQNHIICDRNVLCVTRPVHVDDVITEGAARRYGFDSTENKILTLRLPATNFLELLTLFEVRLDLTT